MTLIAPQPTFARVATILWFPFFLAVAMSMMFVVPLSHPLPNGMAVGIEGDEMQAALLQARLNSMVPNGFDVALLPAGSATAAVSQGRVAAAVITRPRHAVLIASAASATRASYLRSVFPTIAKAEIIDVNPSLAGDRTGAGIFFYALPIAVVAMVTSIVLLQLGMWPMRRRMIVVASVGVFTALVTYAVASWQFVVPLGGASLWLIPGTLVFVSGIGWTLIGAAPFVKQFFIPTALTFVLVLGVPTAGAPVSVDMLPTALQALHAIMPMAQFIALVRALAYGVGSPLFPSIVLFGWLAIGSALALLADAHSRRAPLRAANFPARASAARKGSLFGVVTDLSGAPLPSVAVWVLNEGGSSAMQALTDPSGAYRLAEVPAGLHHILVVALNTEPSLSTLDVDDVATRHDFRIERWTDPAGNLLALTPGAHGSSTADREAVSASPEPGL